MSDVASQSPTRDENISSRIPPSDTDLRRRARLIAAVTWALVIMALCWLPHGVVRKVENGSSWFEIANLDKAVHAGIFAVFGVLCLRALAGPKRAIQVVLLGLALAALTELVQELPLIGRDAGFDDVFADLVGVIAGVLIGLRIEPVFRNVEDRLFRAPAAT